MTPSAPPRTRGDRPRLGGALALAVLAALFLAFLPTKAGGGQLLTAPPRPAPPPAVPTSDPDPGVMVLQGHLDWGDPDLVESGGTYYLYASQSLATVHVPMVSALPGGHWVDLHDALPTLPSWAVSWEIWAPDVHRFGSTWVLYFAATVEGTSPVMHCIGDAVADTPTGPFLPASQPLVCHLDQGGSIDPRVYVSPAGVPYMIYKSDNNVSTATFGPTVLWSQALSPNGLAVEGSPTAIFEPDQAWQHGLVEAPDMVTVNGATWLFFSGGAGYWEPDYAIGVARCAGPEGPCEDTDPQPLLASNAQGSGPGEESVFSSGGRYWLVYDASAVDNGSVRPAAVAPLVFGRGGPSLGNPSDLSLSGLSGAAPQKKIPAP